MPTTESRPPLTDRLSAEEFLRWYWLRAELAAFARILGLGAGGAKTELTDRIAARLAGRSIPAAVPNGAAPVGCPSRSRRPRSSRPSSPAASRCASG